jgi:hypothetical protein
VTRGGDLYLWYYKTAKMPLAPMGVTSSPAPTDVPGIYSVPIGHSGAARYGEMVSHGVAELNRLLVRYALIDKIKPPWLPFKSQIADISAELPLGHGGNPVRDQ